MKNILLLIFFDLKSFFIDIINVIKTFKGFIIFIIFNVIITFWLLYSLIIFLFFLAYYFTKFFSFYLKKFNKNETVFFKNLIIPEYYYRNSYKINFYYYFIYIQKLKAFDFLYNIIYFLKKKNKIRNNIIYIFVIILILPIRFLIKTFTCFSYFSLKISINLTNNFLNLLELYPKNFSIMFDNFFIDLNSSYLYEYIFLIKNYNIYYKNNFLELNPNWYELFFKNPEKLKKSLLQGYKFFQVRIVETEKDKGHPNFIFDAEKNDKFKKFTIIQSSVNERETINLNNEKVFDKSVLNIDEGVLGKPGVNNFSPVYVDTKTEKFNLINVNIWKDIEHINFSKQTAFKTLISSFFKKDYILKNGLVYENSDHEFFINRLLNEYQNDNLPYELKKSTNYLMDFITEEGILNNVPKMIAYSYLISKVLIISPGNVFLPDFDDNNLPDELKNILQLI